MISFLEWLTSIYWLLKTDLCLHSFCLLYSKHFSNFVLYLMMSFCNKIVQTTLPHGNLMPGNDKDHSSVWLWSSEYTVLKNDVIMGYPILVSTFRSTTGLVGDWSPLSTFYFGLCWKPLTVGFSFISSTRTFGHSFTTTSRLKLVLVWNSSWALFCSTAKLCFPPSLPFSISLVSSFLPPSLPCSLPPSLSSFLPFFYCRIWHI